MESMKQKFFRAAVPLVMLAVSAALSVFVYRLPQPVREPLPVLMYHHMVPDGQDCNDMTVTPGKFRSDLETVLAMGYTPVLPQELAAGDALPEKPILITFDDGYRSNYDLVNLRDNEFVAILGPSGSGKTTLLNIIGGLDRYDSGDLIINGISTKKYKDRDWDSYRNHTIGFVFQSYNLIPHQTVLANVELALTISGVSKEVRRKKAIAALEKVGLGKQLHKRPSQMSGGQMQRASSASGRVSWAH